VYTYIENSITPDENISNLPKIIINNPYFLNPYISLTPVLPANPKSIHKSQTESKNARACLHVCVCVCVCVVVCVNKPWSCVCVCDLCACVCAVCVCFVACLLYFLALRGHPDARREFGAPILGVPFSAASHTHLPFKGTE
jgi:hypothetical protein